MFGSRGDRRTEAASPAAASGVLPWRPCWDVVAAALAAVLAQGATVGRGLVWDDLIHVEHLQLTGRWRLFAPDPFGFVRPGKTLLLSLLHRAFGEQSLGWQLAGLASVALAAWLVLLLGRRFLSRQAALAAAIVYAVHPFHVEGSGWASALNGAWMAILAVGYYIALLDYAERPRRGDAARLTVLFLAALAMKEDAVVVPVLGALCLHGASASRPRRVYVVAAVHLALAACFVVFHRWSASRGGQELIPPAYPAWLMSVSAPRNILAHVLFFFWPFRWVFYALPDYDPPAFFLNLAVGLVAAAAVAAWAWHERRRPGRPLVFILFSAIALLPMSNLVPTGNNVFGVRFLSHAGVGLALLAGWAWGRLETCPPRCVRPARIAYVAWVVAAAVVAAAFHGTWRDHDALFSRMARVNPHAQAYIQRAIPRFRAGRLDEVDALVGAGLAAERDVQRRRERQCAAMETIGLGAFAPRPPEPSTALRILLGMVRFEQGRPEDAARLWHEAEKIEPYDVDLAVNLARYHEWRFDGRRGDDALPMAERYYRIAVQGSTPNAETAYVNLGVLLAASGREPEALHVWQEGLVRFPYSDALRSNLAIARRRTARAS